LKGGIEVLGQLCVVGVTRTGQRPYDYQATGGKESDSVAHQMTQSALHLVAHDRSAHGLADDETRTAFKVDDESRAACPTTPSYRGRKVLAPPQPMLGRQHDVMT
jgi:hypothetical protein